MLIKIIILLFILFVFSRIFSRFKRKEITIREFLFWFIFWILVAIVVITPQSTDVIAKFLGVERGSFLLVYLSIIFLFYLVFRIFVRLEKIEQNITKIVRKIAIDEKETKK